VPANTNVNGRKILVVVVVVVVMYEFEYRQLVVLSFYAFFCMELNSSNSVVF